MRSLMYKLVVCIFFVFPLFSGASDDFPLEFSLSSGYMFSQNDDLLVQQQEIKFNFNFDESGNDIFSFDFSPQNNSPKISSPQYGNLLFNHYQQVFTSAMLASQVNPNAENEIQLHYLHFGSNYPISKENNIWFSAGLGVTYFSASNRQFNDDIKLSMSFGVHKDFAVNNNFNIRVESRVYSIFLDGENATLCQQLACGSTDSLWLQSEVSLSVNFRF